MCQVMGTASSMHLQPFALLKLTPKIVRLHFVAAGEAQEAA